MENDWQCLLDELLGVSLPLSNKSLTYTRSEVSVPLSVAQFDQFVFEFGVGNEDLQFLISLQST